MRTLAYRCPGVTSRTPARAYVYTGARCNAGEQGTPVWGASFTKPASRAKLSRYPWEDSQPLVQPGSGGPRAPTLSELARGRLNPLPRRANALSSPGNWAHRRGAGFVYPPSTALSWQLAVAAPGAERRVSARLDRHGLPHHYFKIMDRCVRRGRAVTRSIPLFPRYIFAWCQGSALYELRKIYEVMAIVPGVVPQVEVDKLLARAQGGDTIVPPPQVAEERFLPGERVRVNAGPYQGFDAIWHCRTGAQRVRVLLGMMGRQVPIDMDDVCLEAAQERAGKAKRPYWRPRKARAEERITVA